MPSTGPVDTKEEAGSRVVQIRLKADPSYIERLGVLYAYPIRMKIVTECYRREMSPTQWQEEFGGGSYGRILGHFNALAKVGWLRKVRNLKAVEGRGRFRDLYRSTELAVLDDDTWARLPTSIQVAFTARCLRLLGERIGGALGRGAVDAQEGSERLFLCQDIRLDNRGWDAAMAAMRDCFFSLTQEQLDAKVRLDGSDEDGVLMTTAMAGFESPLPGSTTVGAEVHPLRLSDDDADLPLSTRMAKVFGDALNLQMLKAVHRQAKSPSQLCAEIGGALIQSFDRRCQLLTELGWMVRLNDEKPILYEGAGPEAFDADLWGGIPAEAARSESWPVFDSFCTKAEEALRHGSFNARQDRHVTFCTFLLDERGRRQVSRALDRCKEELRSVATQARRRAGGNGTPPPHVATILLARFEDPDGDCDC